ncbi:unnamed protein product [Microthlaspi erraticum]|uniref:Tf2-1-like SH3-like domain-containing protein n=1 Tax=Microthlaspi erraticum TaxID=1685480 RepID=A0A6D2I783_9BRAS|nr:unnamed protein product [Microthlaspi erraticum]
MVVELVVKMASSFAYPVELRPCTESFLAPHVSYAPKYSKRPIPKTKHAYVYLKVAAQKGKDRFGKIGKLAVCYIGPYKIIGKVGIVAYRLELPPEINLHPVFHVFMLRKHVADPNAIEPE